MVHCSECGQPVPPDANFCPSCGAKIEPAATSADDTTGAFDPIDVAEPSEAQDVGALPPLAPGTGMVVVVRGPGAGSRFLLDRDVTTVGRHPDADIFLDDVTVSRRHVEFVRDHTSGIAVRDLGSLNGTYVGGQRVDDRQLVTGDELQIGRFKLLFVGEGGVGLMGHDT